MARPPGSPILMDEDKGYLCADCGASITITGSLANTTDIVEKRVMIDMAESGATMYSSYSCKKTHFVKDRRGQLVSITTEALYVKTANQESRTGLSGQRWAAAHSRFNPIMSEGSDLHLIKIDLGIDWRK